MEIIGPHLTLNDGWEELDEEKRGLVATSSDAELIMNFNVTELVEKLNFIVMQSYGEDWADSCIEVKAKVLRRDRNAPSSEQTMQMNGFHAKNTSESFNYKMELGKNKAMSGDELIINIDLVGGTTFKIVMGMIFCRF